MTKLVSNKKNWQNFFTKFVILIQQIQTRDEKSPEFSNITDTRAFPFSTVITDSHIETLEILVLRPNL